MSSWVFLQLNRLNVDRFVFPLLPLLSSKFDLRAHYRVLFDRIVPGNYVWAGRHYFQGILCELAGECAKLLHLKTTCSLDTVRMRQVSFSRETMAGSNHRPIPAQLRVPQSTLEINVQNMLPPIQPSRLILLHRQIHIRVLRLYRESLLATSLRQHRLFLRTSLPINKLILKCSPLPTLLQLKRVVATLAQRWWQSRLILVFAYFGLVSRYEDVGALNFSEGNCFVHEWMWADGDFFLEWISPAWFQTVFILWIWRLFYLLVVAGILVRIPRSLTDFSGRKIWPLLPTSRYLHQLHNPLIRLFPLFFHFPKLILILPPHRPLLLQIKQRQHPQHLLLWLQKFFYIPIAPITVFLLFFWLICFQSFHCGDGSSFYWQQV